MALTERWTRFLMALGVAALLFAGFAISFLVSSSHHVFATSSGFNTPGNLLISDQFNNRVIEVNRSKQIVWSFGSGKPTLCNPGPGAIIGLNDAERLSNGLTLLAGTGIPPHTVPGLPNGCVDNRVIVVNQAGKIVMAIWPGWGH